MPAPSTEPRVSVIIPVYNAMPYLLVMLESLAAQDLPVGQLEIIAVDDGSTDGSGAALDDHARRLPHLQVIHQENSGWPGRPRNVGLVAASGQFVFFADADDHLGPEALRRLLDFADSHGSDVVVPKLTGTGGRETPGMGWTGTVVDADMEEVLTTLSPQKLFRRSMLLDAGIFFPEGMIRLEDGMMLVRAYYAARRVSLLADYDYYFIRRRDDGQNISSRAFDPTGYVWSIGEVARLVHLHDPDSSRASRIILDLYVRKCLKMYEPERFAKMPDARRDQWIAQHQALIETWVPTETEAELPHPFRTRSELVRAGDKAGLLTWGQLEAGAVRPVLSRAVWTFRSLTLDLELELMMSADRPGETDLHLQDRESAWFWDVSITELARPGSGSVNDAWRGLTTTVQYTVKVPRSVLRRIPGRVVDVYVREISVAGEHSTRVLAHAATLPPANRSGKPYSTIRGNFSIRASS